MSIKHEEILQPEAAIAEAGRLVQVARLSSPAGVQPGQKWLRRALIGLELFTGIAAVGGGILLIAGPSTMLPPVEYLRSSPFTSYTVPGIALLVLIGGSNVLAAAALLRRRRNLGLLLSISAGAMLFVFEVAEAATIGMRMWLQPFMFAMSLLLMGLVLAHGMRTR
jgi:hypothetical protein